MCVCVFPYLRDQAEAQDAAHGADEQQQQLPPEAPPQRAGEHVHHRRHQALQTHKLDPERGGLETLSSGMGASSGTVYCVY